MSAKKCTLTLAEQLTHTFYEWERRGRGWQIWREPIDLEPPYAPFYHFLPEVGAPIDDGHQPTLMSSFIRWLSAGSSDRQLRELEKHEALDTIEPDRYVPSGPLVELQLTLPLDALVKKEASIQFLLSLPHGLQPVAFEIVGTTAQTIVQFSCPAPFETILANHIRSYFPKCIVTSAQGYFQEQWLGRSSDASVIMDFGLSDEFMRPLRTFSDFDPDPLLAAYAAMEALAGGEVAALQMLFQPVAYPWHESIINAVSDGSGGSFFADAQEMMRHAYEKISYPLFAVVLRVAANSRSFERSWHVVRAVAGALQQFAKPLSNELIPLENSSYDDDAHELALLRRTTYRSGMLLNGDELVGMVHLPSASVRSRKLVREINKTKAAPATATGHTLVLGENHHAGRKHEVSLSDRQRLGHTHMIGATGTGKSHLLLSLLIQDIQNGNGVAVLDPHGDLIDQLLGYIPEHRIADVVLFDPADEEYPIGFNILEAHSSLEKQLLESDLVAVFQRLSTSWGDRMTAVLANAILAFLESREGGTLADLRRFLIEKNYRERFLQTVSDSHVRYFWSHEFPLLSGRPQAPILTRLNTFLRPKLVRNIVSQPENQLDFRRFLDTGTIFLAKLAHGAIGQENAHLLGTLLVSKLYQTALTRQEVQAEARKPYFLCVDEFHHFISPSLSTILSGTRKYGLGVTLVNHNFRQIAERDGELASAVLTNPATRICFRIGDQSDAKKMEAGFTYFAAKDLQNLGLGEAICRVERADYDFNLTTLPLPDLDPKAAATTREAVVAHSRNTYATPVGDLPEDPLLGTPHEVPTPTPESSGKPVPSETPPTRKRGESGTQAALRFASPPNYERTDNKLGRGGPQHTYLQTLIKRWAESNGWRVNVEYSILDNQGSVDVCLNSDEKEVACEISVTSTPEQELRNVQKCLSAGFADVIVISANEKHLERLNSQITTNLDADVRDRVHFCTPEALFAFLESRAPDGTGQVVGGYNVQVRYGADNNEDRVVRRRSISNVILRALKRTKRD